MENKEIKIALKKSNKLIKNFNVYLAIFESDTRRQVSNITKDEYDKMQNEKFIGSKHEDTFFKDLPDYDTYVDSSTVVLNKENFAMAFYPMVWRVLTLEEKITVCRIAWEYVFKREVKEFCNSNSNGVVFVGKGYRGAFNIGSLFRDDLESIDILMKIFNGENTIKDSLYINRLMSGKKYNTIYDFESFEEMQYVSPLEPKDENLDNMSDTTKAYYFDQIYKRKFREAKQSAIDIVMSHSGEIMDLYPPLKKDWEQIQADITQTNLFVLSQLGSKMQRDEEYLNIKVKIFNNCFVDIYNKMVADYNKLFKQYQSAGDVLESMDLQNQMQNLKTQMDKVKANIIKLEDAKEHFKEHFKPKNETIQARITGCSGNEKMN